MRKSCEVGAQLDLARRAKVKATLLLSDSLVRKLEQKKREN